MKNEIENHAKHSKSSVVPCGLSTQDEKTSLIKTEKKMATINDVSLLANVSNATVSRVFNGNATVKKETKELVLKAAMKLGYNPEAVDDLLGKLVVDDVTVANTKIGMVVSQISTASFGHFYVAAQQRAIQEGKQLMIFNGEGIRSREKEYVKLLCDQGCKIILLVETELRDIDVDEFIHTEQVIIRFDSKNKGLSNSLGYDHASACASACQYLIAKNHKEIALFTGKGQLGEQRVEGYKAVFEQYKLPMDSRLVIDQTEEGSVASMELCRKAVRFSAIIAANDKMAAEAMATLRQFGYEIPEDVSVVSLEGSELAEFTYPRLTTVEMPMNEIASELISLSIEMTEDESWGNLKGKRLPGKLIARESVVFFKPTSEMDMRDISRS
ncbi:LacI family DNA-binding transcriptional regulator [Vibrio hannami]|uniref:LacI family DNA-binding transcriptional regulator n=1 Tax=Vibrio hannami TaxID=2717094 RepID=UPI00240FFAF2|nr:LacI family DNA-binding transcriptional regulator [Vibrio hannami]MDG3085298.1 LacI family DNA-binding transcriptional regulator [Vibrio hannami]